MTVTVKLGPELEQYVNEKVREGEFRTAGDVLQSALERLIEEEAEIAHTEALLQEAADSGDYVELTEQEWDRMEREALEEVSRHGAGSH